MKRIISTQIPDQFEKLKKLFNNNVELLNIPMIEIETVEAYPEILSEIKKAINFNWVIFTSMRGVQSFFKLYDQTGLQREAISNLMYACIGESTNEELEKYGFEGNYINQGNTSKEFSKYLINDVLSKTDKVFLPLGDRANQYLPNKLAEFCDAIRVNVYKTKGTNYINEDVFEIIKEDAYDIIVFTSPSAFDSFIEITGFNIDANKLKIASIGTTTSKSIEKNGLKPLITTSKSNLKILTKEILEYIRE